MVWVTTDPTAAPKAGAGAPGRCSASTESDSSSRPTAGMASAIVTGPWSCRKAANGANSEKPSRLRASRRSRVSKVFSTSIAASSAQPVSRPMLKLWLAST